MRVGGRIDIDRSDILVGSDGGGADLLGFLGLGVEREQDPYDR